MNDIVVRLGSPITAERGGKSDFAVKQGGTTGRSVLREGWPVFFTVGSGPRRISGMIRFDCP